MGPKKGRTQDNGAIIFRSDPPILSSVLVEKHLGFAMKWKQWKPREVTLSQRGILTYMTDSKVGGELDIRFTSVSYIPDEILLATLPTENLNKFTGLTFKCKTSEGYDTYFRCILDIEQFEALKAAIRIASKENNLNSLGPIPQFSEDQIEQHAEAAAKNKKNLQAASVMRRTIAATMNQFDVRSRHDQIVSKRGALRWLPTFFDNDLIHGSWWFTIGSIGFMLTSAITLANDFDGGKLVGEDDSTLPQRDFRATWVLMVVSGAFCIFGSLMFVRALHEDPPMRPLFPNWYHIQNDELLGSWFFFLAMVPFVPYTLIYLAAGGYRSLIYLVGLILAMVACLASFLFVLACYPTEATTRTNRFMPVMKFLCMCFLSRRWMQTHLRNDWLAGVWFFLWGSSFATFGNLILLLEALSRLQTVQIFVLGTGLFENFAFMVGSAYFVAGSYPDGAMVIDDDFLDTSIEDEDEGGFYLKAGRGGHASLSGADPDMGHSTSAMEMLAGRGMGVRRGNEVVNPLIRGYSAEALQAEGRFASVASPPKAVVNPIQRPGSPLSTLPRAAAGAVSPSAQPARGATQRPTSPPNGNHSRKNGADAV